MRCEFPDGLVLKSLILAIVCLVMTVSALPAASASCRMGPPPKIAITFNEGNIAYHHNLNRKDIAALGRIGPARLINGLSHFQARRNTRYAYRLVPQGGRICAIATRIDISLSLGRIDVYLARELRRGSCAFRVTLAHENQHVSIHRQGQKRLATRLRQVLSASAMRLYGKGNNKNQAAAALGRAIERIITPLAQKTAAITAAFDRNLDSPAMRREEARRCQG